MASTEVPPTSERPWYEAYPAARNKDPATISRQELRDLMDQGDNVGKDFVLVDLRRADHEVSQALSGPLRLSAIVEQKGRAALSVDLSTSLRRACIRQSQHCIRSSRERVITTLAICKRCWRSRKLITKSAETGSSRGRGNRAAAWFDDYIQDRGDSDMNSCALLDGIKGWASADKEFTDLMDEYVEAVWKK
ncbi:hypothetical protein LTR66_004576 [Elasticomyces elasticus]|nr:hypothetical protein LTR66_004576 [Elasticomyces elasticus]